MNQTDDESATDLKLSLPTGDSALVLQNGKKVAHTPTGNRGCPWRAELKVTQEPSIIEIICEAKK